MLATIRDVLLILALLPLAGVAIFFAGAWLYFRGVALWRWIVSGWGRR
jgi:hypothetical protein